MGVSKRSFLYLKLFCRIIKVKVSACAHVRYAGMIDRE